MGIVSKLLCVFGCLALTLAKSVGAVSVNSDGLDSVSTSEDVVIEHDGIEATFATRLAGAVHFLKWDGHTVVPELEGNGGSLQTALCFDIPPGESCEVENPTEAGSVEDSYGDTTSQLLKFAASDKEVYTKSRMAYYYPPGRTVRSSPHNTKGRGDDRVSDVVLRKRVTLENDGIMRYKIRLEWDSHHWFVQVQILAVYLSDNFDKLYVLEDGRAKRKKLHDFDSSPPDTARPLIIAKSDDAAVGLVAVRAPRGTYPSKQQPWYTASPAGGAKDFGDGLRDVGLTSISAVWHDGSQLDESESISKKASFEIALVFGSLDKVVDIMHDLT